MAFVLLIILRVLFIACMVFIIGYVFGSFSKKPALRTITRVATILVILIYIGMNIFVMRGIRGNGYGWCHRGYPAERHWRHDGFPEHRQGPPAAYPGTDSTARPTR
ncbi:hypothetical protein [Compostibacter hankyongensis]|uniref:Uncharacterized protein n=1 Tax=Compostibacter hankyongensis TaxID=1007089 RepID=A0ABP8G871_9BACT